MDGDSSDPDANTCIFNNNEIDFGISARTLCVQVCLFVSIFNNKEFVS